MKTSTGGFVLGVIGLVMVCVALERGGVEIDLISTILLSIGLAAFVKGIDT